MNWIQIPRGMVIIGVGFGSAVASAIPLPGPHRNTQKLKKQESPTGADKEISARRIGSGRPVSPVRSVALWSAPSLSPPLYEPWIFQSATESAQPLLHFLNIIGQKLRIGPMHSKIHGSYNGGDRLGALQSATERTGDTGLPDPIRLALISLSAPVGLSCFFNFCVFLCGPGRGMAEATADPNPTPIITIPRGIWIQFISRGPWRNPVQFPIHSTQRAGPESRQWCVESHGLAHGVILGIYWYGNILIEELFNPCYIQITLYDYGVSKMGLSWLEAHWGQ